MSSSTANVQRLYISISPAVHMIMLYNRGSRIKNCVHKQLVSDKASHYYKNLQSSTACRDSCSAESFTILESSASSFQVKIKVY